MGRLQPQPPTLVEVSTRMLLVLSLITGVVILVAFAVQVLLLT